MKIEINVQAKDFEVANVLLGRMVTILSAIPDLRAKWKITENELLGAEKVKDKLLKSFLKTRNQ